MRGDDFLDAVAKTVRPEPNVEGSFDCMECEEEVEHAVLDRKQRTLRWWCSKDHESVMEKVNL
jgi:hypothetical protein